MAAGRCHRGHLMEGDNLYVAPSGKRICRICGRRRTRALNRRKKAAHRLESTLRKCVICGRHLPAGLRADRVICERPECRRARHRGHYRIAKARRANAASRDAAATRSSSPAETDDRVR